MRTYNKRREEGMSKYRAQFYKEIEVEFEAENSFDADDWCKANIPIGYILKDFQRIESASINPPFFAEEGNLV